MKRSSAGVLALRLLLVLSATCWSGTAPVALAVEQDQDLTGEWDGGADDWAAVKLKAIKGGYIGTYSSTYNGQLGNFRLEKTGKGSYKGEWWENNLMRHGSFDLEVSRDGQSITLSWKATDNDESKPKEGKSIWKRKK